MAINERVITGTTEAAAGAGSGNQEEGLILHLDANDVDSYDGDGTEWVDIANHEYKPATNPSEHFNTVLFNSTGVDGSQVEVDGVGFQPDLVWLKPRNYSHHHRINDSVRGVDKTLKTNTTGAELSSDDFAVLSFNIDGFDFRDFQESDETLVAWCFKAGGAAVSNTDGSITSSVSVNTDLGFSIVDFTSDSSAGLKVGHGLGVTPEMIIYKRTDAAQDWYVETTALGGWYEGVLNSTAAFSSNSNTMANSTTINSFTGSTGRDYIAYCFASKRGVSKVGSYEGTGVSGNKVYTGFEPAWVMLKNADDIGSWRIYDNVRGVTNALYPNLSNAEATGLNNVTFNRDGFTVISTGGSYNGNNETYIYLAFAKDTNETSLIPDTDLELHLDAASFPQKGESGYSNTPTTWTDSSGNNNNSTITGTTFDSELGNYLNFNAGNDYVVTPEIGDTTTFSYEIWINPTNANASSKYIIGEQVGGQIFANNGTIRIYSNSFNRTFSGSPTISNNVWTHIVLSVSSGVATIYVNGENKGTSNDSNTGITAPIYIGTATTQIGNSLYNISGKIGQVRVYSSALSQDQIRQNFNFTKNDYPNGYNGTINGATFLPSGVSFDFDGSNDYVKIPATNHSPVDFTKKNYTISCWINPDNNTTLQPIFTKYGGSGDDVRSIYFNIHSNGTLRLYQRATGTDNAVYSSGTISASTWTHVAVVRDSSTVKFYINGDLDVSRNSTFTPNAGGTQAINIGSQADGNYRFFNGKISDVKLFDRVLTSDEISAQEAIGYNGIG